MKKTILIFCEIIVLCNFGRAQNKFFFEFCGNGGISFPVSPKRFFGDYWQKGFSFGGAIGGGISVMNANLVFKIKYDSNNFGLNGSKTSSEGLSYCSGETSISTLMGEVKMEIPINDMIMPYFCGGMGLFTISRTLHDTYGYYGYDDIIDENSFSGMLGGGITFGFPMGIFVEGNYSMGFTAAKDIWFFSKYSQIHFFLIKLGVQYRT